jgi:hypothetical protein
MRLKIGAGFRGIAEISPDIDSESSTNGAKMIRYSTCLLLFLGLGLASSVPAQQRLTPEGEIERAFAQADNLEVINRISDLPPDVISVFRSVVRWDFMADWGEAWNSTDVVSHGDLVQQHVFSAISEAVVVVVFQAGGIGGTHTNVAVAQRDLPGFCLYQIGDVLPREISTIQYAFRNRNVHGTARR